jgi:hypothetical protein
MLENIRETKHIFNNQKIPESKVLYQFEKKNLILDNVTFKIREDGIVITNRFNKENTEYYTWNLFDQYTTNDDNFFKIFNPKTKKKHIGFKLKDEFKIYQRRGPAISWILIPITLQKNENIREFINRKLRPNNQKTNSNIENILILTMIITYIIIIYNLINTGYLFNTILISILMFFLIYMNNIKYK